jgi:hypothetical protein
VKVLTELRNDPSIRRLEEAVRTSERVRLLLSHQSASYRPGTSRSVYYKWQGLHWALASLADIGYPKGDPALKPLMDRALELWLRPSYLHTYVLSSGPEERRHPGVPVIQGRARRCGSQQGNALRYTAALGGPDLRCEQLSRLLLSWQWPDGGWNCDTHPGADTSSFEETLLAMRGLAEYAKAAGDAEARRAAQRASEVFLRRRMFRRASDKKVMDRAFLRTHFPLYWHYDVLGGLKGMAEVGRIRDPRCREALDWLEDRELAGGGWAADAKYYRVSHKFQSSSEFVDWGPTARDKLNEWVTTDALQVLRAAGRL